jgi:hypothetical protein
VREENSTISRGNKGQQPRTRSERRRLVGAAERQIMTHISYRISCDLCNTPLSIPAVTDFSYVSHCSQFLEELSA